MKKGIGLTNKMIIAFLGFIVLPIIVMGFLFYDNSKNVITEQQKASNYKNIENINFYYIDQFTNRVDAFLSTWTKEDNFEEILSNPKLKDQFEKEWASALKSNLDVDSIYLGTEKGDMFMVPFDTLPEGYDPRTRPWYKEAVSKEGQTIWTQPYLDAGSKGMLLSVSKQVNNAKGDRVGVLSLDLKLNKLVEIINNIQLGREGYVVLLDKEGYAVAINDEKLIGTDLSELDWVKKAFEKQNGSTMCTINGKPYFMSYMTDKKTSWKLVGIVPKAELDQEVSSMKTYMQQLYAMLGAWVLLACIALIIIFRQLIAIPLNKIMKHMEKAEQGNLNIEIENNYKDEMGQLYHSFGNMIQGQKQIIHQVMLTAKNLEQSSKQTSDIAKETAQTSENQSFSMVELTKAIEDMSISVNDVTLNIADIATSIKGVNQSMIEMGLTAEEVTRNTVETSEAMHDVTQSLEEMEASIALVSVHAENASMQGQKSVEIVSEGKQVVDETIHEMDKINRSTKALTHVITELGKAANQIGEIVEVIEDISEQTNLLSLNASIEAARAGEQGKGFAVVASAIGRLSEKSGESTKDIEKLIKHIQEIVEDAVETTVKSAATIQSGVEMVMHTENAFNKIAKAIDETKQLLDEIAHSTAEQKEASQVIMAATIKVNELTMHVSAASEEQLATVEEIVRATDKVNELTQNVSNAAEVQAANSQEIAATALTVNEMTEEVTQKSEEAETVATELTRQAKELMDVVIQFKV